MTEDKKGTLQDMANQRGVACRAQGWKIHLCAAQLRQLVSAETPKVHLDYYDFIYHICSVFIISNESNSLRQKPCLLQVSHLNG